MFRRSIVTIATVVNSVALWFFLETVFTKGIALPIDVNTKIVFIALFYMINFPALMVVYFDYFVNKHGRSYDEDGEYTLVDAEYEFESEEDAIEETRQQLIFRVLVGIICVLQNYFFWTLMKHQNFV